jgi:HEAT repeat protein
MTDRRRRQRPVSPRRPGRLLRLALGLAAAAPLAAVAAAHARQPDAPAARDAAPAQTPRAAATAPNGAAAPATAVAAMPAVVWDDPMFDFGEANVTVPQATRVNRTAPRNVELLADAMARARNGAERAGLLAEIGMCQLPQGVPPTRAAMADADPVVRLEAIRSAGAIADAALRPDVAKFLADADPTVRREAMIAAHAIDMAADASGPSPAVAAALADPAAAPAVLTAALRRAGAPEAAAVAALLPKLSPALQPEAARALGRLKASAHAGDLVPLLGGAPAQRAAAALALADTGATDRLDAILPLLQDTHPTVRRAALVAVGQLAAVEVRQARALAALDDADPSVRTAAAEILGRHPLVGAVPALLRQLSDPIPELHDAARLALANPALPEMRELVTDHAAALLDDPDNARRIDGSFLLGRLRSDKNRARHVSFLEIKETIVEPDVLLMIQAAESLGQIGVKEAGPYLGELARRTPTTVLAGNPKNFLATEGHVAVFVACGKLADPEVLPEAERLLSVTGGQPSPLRGAAVFALAAATDPADARVNARLLAIAQNDEEYSTARYEAIKALVRRKVPGTEDVFRKLAETSADRYAKFAAHWALGHLTGERRPYVPPTVEWQAVTSVSDLTGGGR